MALCCETCSLSDHLVALPVAGYTPAPSLAAAELMLQCEHCNDKRKAAKTVQELSSDLFFACFVKVSLVVPKRVLCWESHSRRLAAVVSVLMKASGVCVCACCCECHSRIKPAFVSRSADRWRNAAW